MACSASAYCLSYITRINNSKLAKIIHELRKPNSTHLAYLEKEQCIGDSPMKRQGGKKSTIICTHKTEIPKQANGVKDFYGRPLRYVLGC